MKPCASAGRCPKEAVVTLRLDFVGDRSMCRECADWALSHGMGREIESNAFVPEWRKRDLRRDMTAVVLG